MPHDVFISHSSKDKLTADAVCDRLESAGIRCWIAPRDIIPGEGWSEAILRGIGACRVMVLVSSENATSHITSAEKLRMPAATK
jgi:TIR domain